MQLARRPDTNNILAMAIYFVLCGGSKYDARTKKNAAATKHTKNKTLQIICPPENPGVLIN